MSKISPMFASTLVQPYDQVGAQQLQQLGQDAISGLSSSEVEASLYLFGSYWNTELADVFLCNRPSVLSSPFPSKFYAHLVNTRYEADKGLLGFHSSEKFTESKLAKLFAYKAISPDAMSPTTRSFVYFWSKDENENRKKIIERQLASWGPKLDAALAHFDFELQQFDFESYMRPISDGYSGTYNFTVCNNKTGLQVYFKVAAIPVVKEAPALYQMFRVRLIEGGLVFCPHMLGSIACALSSVGMTILPCAID